MPKESNPNFPSTLQPDDVITEETQQERKQSSLVFLIKTLKDIYLRIYRTDIKYTKKPTLAFNSSLSTYKYKSDRFEHNKALSNNLSK